MALLAVPVPLPLAFAAFVGFVGCSKTPPEPVPAPVVTTDPRVVDGRPAVPEMPVVTPQATSAHGSGGKCITPLPAEAPAIPPPASDKACPPDPDPNQKLATVDVTFPDVPKAPKVVAEIVKAPAEVERGLMYRRAMGETRGMLFRLEERRDHTFWMHNTCIPLDMLFVDEDGTIVGIVESATPLTDDVRHVGCPSRYVLELNAGFSRKHGIKPGQKLALPFAAR